MEELHSSQQESLILSREDSPPPRSLSSHQFGAGANRLQDSMNTSIWASFSSANDGASTLNPLKLHQVSVCVYMYMYED